ncbi:helix-turn-helix domain-containing protein [Micromonospora sp. STR1s_5]|nr:helix-turn-helix domain-containing protein [Micromonospora sp. STR1s_5]
MRTDEQRRLLGEFVRAHRERSRPDGSVGRRRTPGLRREELAARAGIGVTWCTWIEQGREVNASPEALARLAVALALTSAERAYLFELAGRKDPQAAPPATAAEAPESIRVLVHGLRQPAYGLDRLWNACAWNRPAERLFAGWLGRGCERNLLRFVFVDRSARALIPDWEYRAKRLLAEFRADFGRTINDPRTRALVEQLTRESAFFDTAWRAQEVTAREGGSRRFNHPKLGPVAYQQHTFSPAERPDYKVVVLAALRSQTDGQNRTSRNMDRAGISPSPPATPASGHAARR